MSEDMNNNLYVSFYPQSVAATNGQCSSIYLNESEVAAISKIDHRRIGGLNEEEYRLLGKVVFALQTAINT